MKRQGSDPDAPAKPPNEWRPVVSSLVTFGAGLAITLGLFVLVRSSEQKRLQADLEITARGRVAAIQADIHACLETIYAMRQLYASSISVERHEFHAAVAESRPRRPEIRSLRWVASVRPSEQAAFEATTRKDNTPGFSIRELTTEGRAVPLAVRTEHLPVVFFEPSTNVVPMVGLDLAADSELVTVLHAARDADRPVLLPRAGLAALEINTNDIVMALPVYRNGLPRETPDQRRANLQGFIVGVFDLSVVVRQALRTLPVSGVHFEIAAENSAGAPTLMHLHASRALKAPINVVANELGRTGVNYRDSLDVAGSRWAIRFVPTESFLSNHRQWGSWILLVLGLGSSGMGARYVLSLRTRAACIEQTVRERTAELQASKEQVRRSEQQVATLVNHIDGIVWELDARTLSFTFVSEEAERLLGYPLQRWMSEPTFWQDHIHPADRDDAVAYCLEHAKRGEPYEFEYRMIAADGREVWLRDLVSVVMKAGVPLVLRGIMVDITESKRKEVLEGARLKRLQQLSELSLLLTGEPGVVFERAVRMVGEMFDVRVVCLSEVAGSELHFKSVYVDGQVFADAGGCNLDITPCAGVKEARDIRAYDRVQERFPQATFLRDHNADAYCGVPCMDVDGQVIAITCLLDDKPRKFTEEDQHILRLIGQRIAVELDRARHNAERKLSELKLEERDALLQKLSEQVPGVIYQYQQFPDGRSCFPYASEGIREIYEVTPEQVRDNAEAVFRVLHPEDLDEVVASIRRSVETMEPWSCVYRVQLPVRGVRWLEGYSVPERLPDGSVLWHGYIRDVTNRKHSEVALQLSEERVRACIETTPNVAVQWYDERGRVLFWNRASESVFGWKSEEAMGRTLDQLIHTPEGAEAFVKLLGEMKTNRQSVGPVEFEFRRRDGSEGVCVSTIFPIPGFDGQPCFVCMDVDVTERRKAEAELLQAKEAAEVASKAKSEFLATMSHEIRTPMNGVIGFTNLLLDTPLNSEQRDFAGTIKNSSEALLGLINDILDFSKIEAGKLSVENIRYDLVRAVKEVADLLAPNAAKKGLEMTVSFAPGLPRQLMGDPGRVRQVLLNLMGNALKFTERGQVRVEVQPATTGAADVLRISISDTGIGIPKDKHAQLFQQFMQADSSSTRRYGGTGLGLAISKRLVELMGGEIGLESERGCGSTFWFTLPAPAGKASPTATEVPPDDGLVGLMQSSSRTSASGETTVTYRQTSPVSPHEAGPANSPRYRVLLAEDNATNQRLAMRLLEKLECRVDVAGNGCEAVEMAQKLPYDVIFMDCHMPDMNGFEATIQIRRWEAGQSNERATSLPRSSSRVPIIAITASAMESDRAACAAAGMDDFISKPVHARDLSQALDKWCRAKTLSA